MSEIDFLKEQIEISAYIDDIIESCQKNRLGLPYALNRILKSSLNKLGAIFGFIYTYDELMEKRLFFSGDKKYIKEFDIHNIKDGTNKVIELDNHFLVIEELNVADIQIGSTGFIFKKSNEENYLQRDKIRVNLFSEEVDNYLYNINHSREKQHLLKELNLALRDPILNNGIINAIKILKNSVSFEDIYLIYKTDKEDTLWHYKYFIEEKLISDSTISNITDYKLSKKLKNVNILSLSTKELGELLNLNEYIENILITGAFQDEELGRIIISSKGKGFNTYAKDLIDLFSQTINYRLVDFNREKNRLRRFFPKDTTYKLLSIPDYKNIHLAPKVKDVAILFTDINGFTKISEQIFDDPKELGDFIDIWSSGAIDIVYKNGGVFDKMVGDCVIALFGPPFFNIDPISSIRLALKTAYEIQEFTISLGEKYDKIKNSDLIDGLGVATGINYAPLNVGFFGPYDDYTGFSSGMNNTARLQSLATFRETYIMEGLKPYLERIKTQKLVEFSFNLSENRKSKVKNVKYPLSYYSINFH